MRPGDGIVFTALRRARFLFYFNAVAPADAAGLNDSAKQAAAPAKRFLKTLADFVDQVTRRAWVRDLQKSLAYAQPLPEDNFPSAIPRVVMFSLARPGAMPNSSSVS